MSMTHRDALRVAREAVRERMASMSQFLSLEDLYDEQDEIQIRAYIEARGLVLVPKEPTRKMYIVGGDANVGPRSTAHGYVYEAMIAAAPDPFGGE